MGNTAGDTWPEVFLKVNVLKDKEGEGQEQCSRWKIIWGVRSVFIALMVLVLSCIVLMSASMKLCTLVCTLLLVNHTLINVFFKRVRETFLD